MATRSVLLVHVYSNVAGNRTAGTKRNFTLVPAAAEVTIPEPLFPMEHYYYTSVLKDICTK